MRERSRRQLLPILGIGLLGLGLPLTLASQGMPHTGTGHTPAAYRYEPHTQPLPYRTSLTHQAVLPPARGFDVATFETLADHLTIGQQVPGISMAIVQNGRVLSARGYGVTDVVSPQPVDAHTVFRLASLSKAFAGTLTGLLVSDGTLRWDSKVSDYVPEFQLNDPLATRRVTVADLLSHRVGLRAYNAYDRDIEANLGYREAADKLATAAMQCMPGECYAYQNVAFSLVGNVVAAASGNDFEHAVEQRLFKPLGMHDASMGLTGIHKSQRWARPHVRSRNGWVSLDTPKPTYYRLAPAAGANASASDMAQWLIAQTGHRPDVLPAPLLATLQAPVIATPGEMRSGWRRDRVNSASYALGWRVFDYAGHRVVFHAGAVQGYRGVVALVPERDLGIAIMWNSESGAPAGLLPTIIDTAIGIPPGQWVDTPAFETLMAGSRATPSDNASKADEGASSDRATASPH